MTSPRVLTCIPMESLTNAICMHVNRIMKVVRVWGALMNKLLAIGKLFEGMVHNVIQIV